MTLRVLVVDDSLSARRRLVAALESDPGIAVVGQAEDSRRAIALCEALRPDVVTLDMVLHDGDGIEVTEHIMARCPTPILIVSASSGRGEALRRLDALEAGAVDTLEKPTGREPKGEWERCFIDAVKLTSRIRVIRHLRGMLRAGEHAPDAGAITRHDRRVELIAMGASTGGPQAVLEILRARTPAIAAPIVLVIHVGAPFVDHLSEWLAGELPIPVTEARDGEPLPAPGEARLILAPADRHLVIQDRRLRLTSEPARHSCRPSVDVFFESVARELGPRAAGCLLTGMGRDGAAGLLAMRRAGAVTLAQDEATSMIFGMPREAIRLGAADRVLPLPEIRPALAALAELVKP